MLFGRKSGTITLRLYTVYTVNTLQRLAVLSYKGAIGQYINIIYEANSAGPKPYILIKDRIIYNISILIG